MISRSTICNTSCTLKSEFYGSPNVHKSKEIKTIKKNSNERCELEEWTTGLGSDADDVTNTNLPPIPTSGVSYSMSNWSTWYIVSVSFVFNLQTTCPQTNNFVRLYCVVVVYEGKMVVAVNASHVEIQRFSWMFNNKIKNPTRYKTPGRELICTISAVTRSWNGVPLVSCDWPWFLEAS